MPAEQLALIFDHLDLALKVFPDEKRIEGVTTLSLRTKAPIKTLILDLFPKFTISEIAIDGRKLAPSAYSNPEGQLRITLAAPFDGRREVHGPRRLCGHAAARQASAVGRRHDVDEDARREVSVDRHVALGRRLRPALSMPRSSDAQAGDVRPALHRARRADGAGQRRAGQQGREGRLDDLELARAQHPHLRLGARRRAVQGAWRATTRAASATRSRCGSTICPARRRRPPSSSPSSRRRSISGRTSSGRIRGPTRRWASIRVPYSGLENQTLIGYSDDYPKTMFGWDWLLNHEFAHEWFANQLSVANYDDLWLHEGLGSYAQPLIAEYLGGEIDYMAQLKSQRAGIRNEQPLVTGPGARGEGSLCGPDRAARRHLSQGQLGRAHAAQADRRRRVLQVDPHAGLRPSRSEARQLHAAVRHDAGLSEDRQRRHRQGLQVVLRRLLLSRRAAQGRRDA